MDFQNSLRDHGLPMNRLIPLSMILLLPCFAHADMGLPGNRIVPVQVTIAVEREYPDHEFFLVEGQRAERIRITPSEPLVLRSEDHHGHVFGIYVHAVPKADLALLDEGALPTAEWFKRDENRKNIAGSLHVKGRVVFTDNRDRIEMSYILRVFPDSCRLELVSENHGNRWVERGWTGLCCVLPPVGIGLLGIWLARRLFRNRS